MWFYKKGSKCLFFMHFCYFCEVKKMVLIVVFLFLVKPVFPVLEYAVNYDYIVENLCVNKAKPEMKCNGKCHLMKQLAKDSESENNDSKDKKSLTSSEFEVLFFEKGFELKITEPFFFREKKINASYNNNYVYHNVVLFFHPPLV